MGNALRWAEHIHTFMTRAGASAWLWWWAVNADGARGDGEGIVYLDPARHSYVVSKRLYTIGVYSRFIRPGYARLAATDQPAPGLYTSAYRAPAGGRLVLVAINDSAKARTLAVRVSGARIARVTPYVTSAARNLARGRDVAAANGTLTVALPPRSVTTLVGCTPKVRGAACD